jgi:hypothetical protein
MDGSCSTNGAEEERVRFIGKEENEKETTRKTKT